MGQLFHKHDNIFISINMSLDTSFLFLIPTSGHQACLLASLRCFLQYFFLFTVHFPWASCGAALSPWVDQGALACLPSPLLG